MKHFPGNGKGKKRQLHGSSNLNPHNCVNVKNRVYVLVVKIKITHYFNYILDIYYLTQKKALFKIIIFNNGTKDDLHKFRQTVSKTFNSYFLAICMYLYVAIYTYTLLNIVTPRIKSMMLYI